MDNQNKWGCNMKKWYFLVGLLFLFSLISDYGYSQNLTQFVRPKKGHPKIESKLNKLVEKFKNKTWVEVEHFARQNKIEIQKGKKIRLVVEADKHSVDLAIEKIESLGVKVETTYQNLIQILAPLSIIDSIAEIPGVNFIRFPYDFFSQAIISEGVEVIGANDWQSKGYYGSGVKVAILDSGFKGYSNLMGTELPVNPILNSFRADGDIEANEVHGTACAEIAYDIAPGAQFYLVNFQTDPELGNAFAWLVSQGVDIISFSMGTTVGPGDGTGYKCDLVESAYNNGVFFVVSAGNYAQFHWEGNFNDPDGDTLHEFSGIDSINDFYVDLLSTGGDLKITLTWDDWPYSNQDFDLQLYYFDTDFSITQLVAVSENSQTGTQPPVESINYTIPLYQNGYYGYVIKKYNATRSVKLEAFTINKDNARYKIIPGSLLLPADSPYAFAVGAFNYATPDTIEHFSSQGPTHDGRIKPDLAAPDNVTTQAYGPSGFPGTSAACPHTAGAAALVLSAFPTFTPDDIGSFLVSRAIDQNTPGKDNVFGYGSLDMGLPPTLTTTVVSITTTTQPSTTTSAVPITTTSVVTTSIQPTTTIVQSTTTSIRPTTTIQPSTTSSVQQTTTIPTTTTSILQRCPATVISDGDQDKLRLLRQYRDKVLRKTPIGRDYVKIFYKHSVEVTSILLTNPLIASDARNVMNTMMPDVQATSQGKHLIITQAQIDRIISLLDAISYKARSGLCKDIQRLKLDLRKSKKLGELGIKILPAGQ
jgi:subtilisin family serine protease